MKRCFMKNLILCLFLGLSVMGFSQKNTDGIFLFKTWLYIEHINDDSNYNTEFPTKDFAVFSLFINNIKLRLDTLKRNGFSDKYVFLSLQLNYPSISINDSLKSLQYNNKTPFLRYIVIPAFCNRYVICINKITGFSYRLQGFTGNDFFNLLNDVKTEYNLQYKKELKTKVFLKEYGVADIDFGCIYKGLQSGQGDSKKYPCLYNCRGSNKVIWTQ